MENVKKSHSRQNRYKITSDILEKELCMRDINNCYSLTEIIYMYKVVHISEKMVIISRN
jgi:hypothetical protein